MTHPWMIAAAALAALHVAHHAGDYWVQTQHQANCKGLPGWKGRLACVRHVTTYTACGLVALLALVALGLPLSPASTTAGLAISAVTHYIADRRKPLRRLAGLLGKDPGWLDNHGGLALMDQSWHTVWIGVAAVVIAL